MTTRDDPRIAVTGVGVLTSFGDTLDGVAAALAAGRSAVEPDVDLPAAGAAPLKDFEATRYVNLRGLRLYGRSTRLGICAVKLALGDARLEEAALEKEQLGVVCGATFGHLQTLLEYDRAIVGSGLAGANPALMPLALASAPGAAISLSIAAKAFSITLSDGGTSSLDALGLGARLLRAGRCRACVVVAGFSPCADLTLSALRAGTLAPAGALRPFDRRHCGTAFGEGAVAFLLERAADAHSRGARVHALVAGQASTFAPAPGDAPAALRRACEGALRLAGVPTSRLGLVVSGADGTPRGDGLEAHALVDLLARDAARTPVTAPKASLGELVDAAGLLQAALAIAALRSGRAPPIAGFEEPQVPGLAYVTREREVAGPDALVTAASQTGSCSAAVLSCAEA